MCSRVKTPRWLRDIRTQFATAMDWHIAEQTASFVKAGDKLPFVIQGREGHRVLSSSTWGVPINDGRIYNARMENVSKRPMWNDPANKRVIIPITSFWERNVWVRPKDDQILPAAGLYIPVYSEKPLVICTFDLLNQTVPELQKLRGPFILNSDDIEGWLTGTVSTDTIRPAVIDFALSKA